MQTNVTVGSGAFQFIIQGVQDAKSLIEQLSSDPILQGKLFGILNAAAARIS